MKSQQGALALAAIALVLVVLYPLPSLLIAAALVALWLVLRYQRSPQRKAVYISDEEYSAAMRAKKANHAHRQHQRYAERTYVGPQDRADDVPPF